jgi:hypothetical protein
MDVNLSNDPMDLSCMADALEDSMLMWDKVTDAVRSSVSRHSSDPPIPQASYDPHYPHSIHEFMTDFGIQEHFSLVLPSVPMTEDYLSLRHFQNKHWATSM